MMQMIFIRPHLFYFNSTVKTFRKHFQDLKLGAKSYGLGIEAKEFL